MSRACTGCGAPMRAETCAPCDAEARMAEGSWSLATALTAWAETPGRAEAFAAQMAAEGDEAHRIQLEREARCAVQKAAQSSRRPAPAWQPALDELNATIFGP